MTVYKCDRCGREIGIRQNKLQTKYGPVDLCDDCYKQFDAWMDGVEFAGSETGDGGADDCQTIELTEKLQKRFNQAVKDMIEKMSKAANPTRYFQKSDRETDDGNN